MRGERAGLGLFCPSILAVINEPPRQRRDPVIQISLCCWMQTWMAGS